MNVLRSYQSNLGTIISFRTELDLIISILCSQDCDYYRTEILPIAKLSPSSQGGFTWEGSIWSWPAKLPQLPHFLTTECETERSHRLFLVLNVSCQWKLEGSCQPKFSLRVAFCCTLEDPSNWIGSLNWHPGADIEEGAVMTPQRFLILVEDHLDHNLQKGRSCCIFTGSLKLHTLLGLGNTDF